jgi:hypothetical protein
MPAKKTTTGAATGSNPNKARSSEQARKARASGAGRPKGSTNKITTVAQLAALQKELGIPFEEAVAKTAGKLYADFKMDKNVREWTDLLKHLSNKLTQDIPKEIMIENPYQQMTADDIKDRLAELAAKLNGE